MAITIEILRRAGLSAEQILQIVQLDEESRRAGLRDRQRRSRAPKSRPASPSQPPSPSQGGRDACDGRDIGDTDRRAHVARLFPHLGNGHD